MGWGGCVVHVWLGWGLAGGKCGGGEVESEVIVVVKCECDGVGSVS